MISHALRALRPAQLYALRLTAAAPGKLLARRYWRSCRALCKKGLIRKFRKSWKPTEAGELALVLAACRGVSVFSDSTGLTALG